MIKTLLVDDDSLVRMFLKQIIDWEAAGFLLIGDARSGDEALELAERDRPELLITDLCMPGMDGIELIERVRQALPDCYIIALSCHGEFEYVKEAMKRGADEYVLKNLLDEDGLRRQLDLARDKLARAAERAEETEQLLHLAEKGTELLRRELVQRLIREPVPLEEQRKLCHEAGLSGQYALCAAISVSAPAARRGALTQVCEQYCRGKPVACISLGADSCCLLVDLTDAAQAAQWDWVRPFAEGLYGCVDEYLNIRPCLGVSALCKGDGGLTAALRQAEAAVHETFYDKRIHYFSDRAPAGELPAEAAALLVQLPDLLSRGAYDEIRTAGTRVLELCRRARTLPADVRRWFADLLALTGSEADTPDNLAGCEQALQALCSRLAEELDSSGGSRAIRQAAAYLRAHYAQPVSLAAVAAEVHLNPAYLSYLFKREMGVNFSDYLLDCRLERIKQLLRQSDQPLKQCAAEAGFPDYRNFCKLFKKQVGLRPAQYRSLNRDRPDGA